MQGLVGFVAGLCMVIVIDLMRPVQPICPGNPTSMTVQGTAVTCHYQPAQKGRTNWRITL